MISSTVTVKIFFSFLEPCFRGESGCRKGPTTHLSSNLVFCAAVYPALSHFWAIDSKELQVSPWLTSVIDRYETQTCPSDVAPTSLLLTIALILPNNSFFMKALNAPSNNALPRSATFSRFRPVSFPAYDYKAPSKGRPDAPADPPPASPQRQPRTKQPVSGAFHLSSIPRILRPGVRPPPTPTATPPRGAAVPYFHPKKNESRCCQMLIHGLYVAFEDDFVDSGVQMAEDLRADGGRPFTHLISLSTRHTASISHGVDRTTGAKRLRLRLPRLFSPVPPTDAEIAAKVAAARVDAAARGLVFWEDDYYDVVFDEGERRGSTGLDALQLLAARDFLYTSDLTEDSPETRVLVTTPRDHRTDAMAAVLGYLSLVLGHRVEKVVRVQDSHPNVLAIWKHTVSPECAAFVEEVCHL